mgnify:CR=1 FL=1
MDIDNSENDMYEEWYKVYSKLQKATDQQYVHSLNKTKKETVKKILLEACND